MGKVPVGAYTYSDSYLKQLRKVELIEHYRRVEENWFNAIETNNTQYENYKTLLKNERNNAIEDSKEAVAKAICIGCGYLKGTECTYTGQNCRTSKPMLEVAMKALDKLKV
jgi:hypothetical protein